jgi:hypothetical protein
MRFTDAYDKALAKQARRDTKRRLRKASPGATITHTVWGRRAQDAYLAQGWHPQAESPRVELSTGFEWSEMTMTITKEK